MPEYEPYLIPDILSKCDNVFKELIAAKIYDEAKVDPGTVNIIRLICSHLRDDDVLRIMRLEQWKMEHGTGQDYWRQRAVSWSRREALYVLACLRWEFQQCWTMKLLNREHEERTRTTTEEHSAQGDAGASDSGDLDDP
ncbi:Hypothetical predicted protein [Lecanosticta acicola]|uniref:Uncharacterized protein n=1 Tax=Lecanosticta acicola TaxID=111012 RepID=A0AAI8YZW7_9PEZI|nr:Hypothetical predicted protein [Lecanosticta acicola]